MADKMTCPGCRIHGSDVWAAYRDLLPCPQCGLSWSAAKEILDIRRIAANEKLKERLVGMTISFDRLKTEADAMRVKLDRISEVLEAD